MRGLLLKVSMSMHLEQQHCAGAWSPEIIFLYGKANSNDIARTFACPSSKSFFKTNRLNLDVNSVFVGRCSALLKWGQLELLAAFVNECLQWF